MKRHKKYNEVLQLLKYDFGWNTKEVTEMQSELINDCIGATAKALTIPVVSKNKVTFCDKNYKCFGCGGTTVLGYCEHGCDD